MRSSCYCPNLFELSNSNEAPSIYSLYVHSKGPGKGLKPWGDAQMKGPGFDVKIFDC